MSAVKITIRAVDFATKPLQKVSKGIKSLMSGVSGLAVAFGGFKLADSFIESNSQLEQMHIKMKAVLGDAKAADQAFAWIEDFQRKNPVSTIQQMTNSFNDLINAGIDPTSGAMESLIAAQTKYGLTAHDISGVTRAFRQMTALPHAQKQEINQLAERIPQLVKKMALEMGKTPKQVLVEMKKVQLSSEDAITAMLKFMRRGGKETMKEYAGTWAAGVNQMKTQWFKLMTEIGDAGAFEFAKNAFGKITSSVSGMVKLIKANKPQIDAIFTSMRTHVDNISNDIKEFAKLLYGADTGILQVVGIVINEMMSSIRIAINSVLLLLTKARSMMNEFKKAKQGNKYRGKDGELNPFGKASLAELDKEEALSLGPIRTQIKDSIDAIESIRRTPLAHHLFSKKSKDETLKAAKEYYKDLLAREAELLKAIDAERAKILDKAPEKESFVDKYKKMMDKVLDSRRMIFSKLSKGFTAKSGKPPEEEAAEGFEHLKKSIEDVNARIETPPELTGYMKAVDEIKTKWEKTYGDMDKISMKFATTLNQSLTATFDTFFDDLLNNKIPDLKAAFHGLANDIIKSMLRIQSQKLAMGITESIGKLAGSMFGGPEVFRGADISGFMNPLGGGGPVGQGTVLSPVGTGSVLRNKVEIINNTGESMVASKATVRRDNGETIMSIVMDSINRNKGGSRDMLRGALA